MKPSPKTLALVAVASGMIVSAYLVGPAPAASTTGNVASVARNAQTTAAPTQFPSYVKTLQAPVPYQPNKHDTYFDASAAPEAAAPPTQQALTMDTAGDSAAKAAIEMDGYRNVRGLVKTPDGMWHGRAMRGRTEIAVVVDQNGSVSQD